MLALATLSIALQTSLAGQATARQPIALPRVDSSPSFRTADYAAIAILGTVNEASKQIDREIGGSICRTAGEFPFQWTIPEVGKWAGTVRVSSCPDKTTFAGDYHTHGAYGGVDPSAVDRNGADKFTGDVYSYLATPCPVRQQSPLYLKWQGNSGIIVLARCP